MKTNFLSKHYDAAAPAVGGDATDFLAKHIDRSFDRVAEQAKVIEGNFQKALQDQNENLQKQIKEQDEKLAKAQKAAEDAQKTVDDINKKGGTNGFTGTQVKSFTQEVSEVIGGQTWKERWTNYKDNGKQKGFHFDLQAKAVGNMGASNLTGSYFSATQVPGIVARPYETIHLRDVLPVGQTDRDTIRYIVDNGGEGGPAMVAAGGTKPQIDRDLEIKDTRVKKIAVHFRIPEEMVEDIPYMQSFLTQIGVEEVMALEDAQILTGDGTGENLSGVYTTATTFAKPTGVTTVASANDYDSIRAAQVQLQLAKFQPAIAVLNPVDWYNMTSTKDTTTNYTLQGGGNGLVPQFSGLRVLVVNQMTAGNFLVGDPRTTAIFDRAGTTVRVFEQDQDNAIKNLITVVIEKRLALVNYRPSAWVKGVFSTTNAALAA
jgi:HK97 family phage major capsid protein